MKRVNQALKVTGIETHADVWRPLERDRRVPNQYIVYVTKTVEDEFYDDAPQSVQIFVYMNLWSAGDPTSAAALVRRAMRKAGFAMEEEETGSASGAKYDENAKMHCVSWTWVGWDVIEDGV